LYDQGKIDDPIISFSLTQLLTQESKAIFGGKDSTQYVQSMFELNLGATNLWAPHVNGLAYGNTYLDKFDNSDNYLAIIDTGSTLIHLPKKYYNIMADWWLHQLKNADFGFGMGDVGLYHARANCYQVKPLISNFSIVLDDTLFEITPESYLLDCDDLPSWACESKDFCLFGIDTMETEMGEFTNKIFILGETFVKNFYTVFTARKPQAQVEMGVSIHF